MPELPKKVTIDLASKKLFVNGEEFPWHLTEEGPRLMALTDPDALPSVTLTFYAEDVEVIPESGPDLSLSEREIVARECDAIAAYLEKLAGQADGPRAAYLATQHRATALAIRARAARHRKQARA
jgi:hypothetical protein